MISDVDWNILMQKLEAIDKRLNNLENDVKVLSVFVDKQLIKKYYGGMPGGGMSFIDHHYVLSQGSLVDAGSDQEWRVATGKDDVEE